MPAQFIEDSLALTTALVPAIGYDAAAQVAQVAAAEGESIRSTAHRTTNLDEKQLEKLLDPKRMVGGGEPGA